MQLANRRAFTLAELLVAVVLLNVGLLALVGGSAAVVRRHTSVRARSIAAQVAKARVELLAAAACGASGAASGGASSSATSGSALLAGGLAEAWTVSTLANGVRELDERVTFATSATPSGVGELSLRTRVSC